MQMERNKEKRESELPPIVKKQKNEEGQTVPIKEDNRLPLPSSDDVPILPTPGSGLKLYFGIDVEKGGRHQRDCLIAVGIAVASTTRGILAKRRWCLPNATRFEARCIAEFWSHYQRLLMELTREGKDKDARQQFDSIESFLLKYEMATLSKEDLLDEEAERRRSRNDRAPLVSDNPSYDVGHVDTAHEVVIPDHVPLHNTREGAYRPVMDCSERIDAQGLSWDKIEEFCKAIGVKNDHAPENDAEKMIWLMFISMACSRFRNMNKGMPLQKIDENFLAVLGAGRTEPILALAGDYERLGGK